MSCSVAQSCPTLCDPMDCSTPGFPDFTVSRSLLKLMFIESIMPSNHLILCRPLLFLPSIFPSIRVFSNKLALHIRLSYYWSFSISPSKEYSGLISFRVDWFDLFDVQGTLFSSTTVQRHQCSAFSIIQFSHPYMTTGKTIALTRWNFPGKVTSLLFNTLSTLVFAFLPSKEQVSFNYMAAVTVHSDFGAQDPWAVEFNI